MRKFPFFHYLKIILNYRTFHLFSKESRIFKIKEFPFFIFTKLLNYSTFHLVLKEPFIFIRKRKEFSFFHFLKITKLQDFYLFFSRIHKMKEFPSFHNILLPKKSKIMNIIKSPSPPSLNTIIPLCTEFMKI